LGLDPSSELFPGRLLPCLGANVARRSSQGACPMNVELMRDQNAGYSSTDVRRTNGRTRLGWTDRPFESRYRSVHGNFVSPLWKEEILQETSDSILGELDLHLLSRERLPISSRK